MSTPAGWLTSQEAADRLGIKDVTLRSWRLRDYGPPSVKFGVAVMYRLEDVDAWLADQQGVST